VTLVLLLAVGSAGAAVSGWALPRGGRAAQWGAVAGSAALLGVVLLAFALDAPRVGTPGSQADAGLLDGRLVPNDYLRLVVALWALDAVLVVFIAWLAGGLAGLRGLLPAMLAAITGGTLAFAATDLVIGAAAAGATGAVALVVLLAPRDPSPLPAAARELRVTLLTTVLLTTSIVVAPVAAGLALRAGAGNGVAPVEGGPIAPAGGPEAVAAVGMLVLAITLAVALRAAAIPFHRRVPHLADAVPPIALPLLLAWLTVPLAVVAVAAVDLLLAPLALPLGGEQTVVVAVACVTLVGASLAAFLQEDLRHAAGYLVIADGALVLLGLAALDPEAWGPSRTWLVALAASKTALLAWAAVVEDRFGSRRIPDLRGWMRRSPLLAAALLLATLASFGLPGWAAFQARLDLGRLAGGPGLDWVLVVLGFLTLPTYLRLLALGTGSTTTRVERSAPERIVRRPRLGALRVVRAGPARPADLARRSLVREAVRVSGAVPGLTRAGRRLMTAVRRDATELSAAAVLTMAILAALTSWGALDIAGAASEPAPIVSGAGSD
jgi:formate hydrogenlyase subunit 3/multisubunit Na+/H+ antiporter MnhD subunit